jgi:hypothetical protein
MSQIDLAKILSGEPNYSHLQLKKRALTIELTAEEQEAVLKAYDRGIEKSELLDWVMAKLKDQIHP